MPESSIQPKLQTCDECVRLWREYQAATAAHIRLAGKQRIAVFAHDQKQAAEVQEMADEATKSARLRVLRSIATRRKPMAPRPVKQCRRIKALRPRRHAARLVSPRDLDGEVVAWLRIFPHALTPSDFNQMHVYPIWLNRIVPMVQRPVALVC